MKLELSLCAVILEDVWSNTMYKTNQSFRITLKSPFLIRCHDRKYIQTSFALLITSGMSDRVDLFALKMAYNSHTVVRTAYSDQDRNMVVLQNFLPN